MNEKAGIVFSIAKENGVVEGCTISKMVSQEYGYYIAHFSLAGGTDIIPESYRYHKLWIVLKGSMKANFLIGDTIEITENQLYVTPINEAVGVSTESGCIYTEITLKEDTKMKEILKDKALFTMKDLVPYQEGKIINMDLISEEKLKFVIMSFTEDTGLSEHAAPGEALIFALDGEGIIGYEGKEYTIHEGENFKFEKNGAHYVKATGNFKMALLLTLE